MERKEVIFGGLANVPDDSMAKDGQLSLLVNAVNKNGSVQPLEEGTPLTYDNGDEIAIDSNERLTYIHHLPDTGEERMIVLRSVEGGGGGEHEYVDLGLPSGTLWATKNVGASAPEEYGDYFAWGETERKEEYDWAGYALCDGTSDTLNKYCTRSEEGTVDDKTELEAVDDAATMVWGEGWQTPTHGQYRELLRENTEWTTLNGVYGLKITSSRNGNSIFLPAAGEYSGNELQGGGENCCYWLRGIYVQQNYKAGIIPIDPSVLNVEDRCNGLTVRPVYVGSGKRPAPHKRRQINKKFVLTDDVSRTVLTGALDEGRTMTLELTYSDGKKEIVSVRFTKATSYVLPTRYNTNNRAVSAVSLVSYDDSSVTLNCTFDISVYYYGMIGSWDSVDAIVEESNPEDVESVEEVAEEPSGDSGDWELCWFNRQDGTRKHIANINSSVREITSIKNVLIISTDAGLFFARNIGQDYQYLGALPELPCVTPALSKKWVSASNYIQLGAERTIDITGWNMEPGEPNKLASSVKEELWVKLTAILDNLRKEIWRKGHFMLPFQVRVAYRMFDGDYISVSRPYPMCPSTVYQPLIVFKDTSSNIANIDVVASDCTLTLKWKGTIPEEWNDIITGFDIFVSPEIADYTADDTGDSIDWVYKAQSDVTSLKDDTNVLNRGSIVNDIPIGRNIPLFLNPSNNAGVNVSYMDALTEDSSNPVRMRDTYLALDGTWVAVSWIADSQQPRLDFSTVTGYPDIFGYYTFYVLPRSIAYNINVKYDFFIESRVPPKPPLEDELEYGYYQQLINSLTNANDYLIFCGTSTRIKEDGTYHTIYNLHAFQVLASCSFEIYNVYKDGSTVTVNNPEAFVHLKRTTGKLAVEEFNSQSAFYKIDSVNFSDLKELEDYTPQLHSTDIELLTSKTQLDNKIVNRYGFNCNDLFAYNNRLNVVVDNQELEVPDYADTMFMGVDIGGTRADGNIRYAVEVVKEGITRFIPVPTKEVTYRDGVRYFFYPNQNAIRLWEMEVSEGEKTVNVDFHDEDISVGSRENPIIEIETEGWSRNLIWSIKSIRSYELKKHEGVAGAYAFNNWSLLEASNTYMYGEFHYDTTEGSITLVFDGGEVKTSNFTPSELNLVISRQTTELVNKLASDKELYHIIALCDFSYEEYVSEAYTKQFNDEAPADIEEKITSGYQKQFHVGNKILQSDVENPFAFLNRGVVQLGCESIKRICAASRPISPGQAGQHPLYAFTDEGIFALAVDSNGEYLKADLISPEVMTGFNVYQVEQSVIFSTSKGLMELNENNITCLSSILEGHNHAEGLTRIENLVNLLGLKYVGSIGYHAKDWFTDAELIYDSKNSLIYLFREPGQKDNGFCDTNIGLVYNVANGTLGMYENKLLYGVNSYTDALAVQMTEDGLGRFDGKGVLTNMSEPLNRDTEEPQTYKSLLVTRPLSFEERDKYKTMEDIILRGAQGVDKGWLVIWASNDLEHWRVIGTSMSNKWRNYSGTPYKYFRIGVLMNGWKEGDSITGASVDITTRLTNKLR